MKLSEMLPSKYLKQSDVDGDVTVTLRKLQKTNVAREEDDPEYKWIVQFAEFEKGMVLNTTNLKRIAKVHGDDTDGWLDQQMILYVDHNIEFGGNVVGGLRLKGLPRAKPNTQLRKKSEAEINAELDDANPPF